MSHTEHTDPDTTQAFDDVALMYDHHFSSRYDRAEEEILFDRFGHLLQRADVLDIGCGTGLVERMSRRLLLGPRSYIGVDLSQKMLTVAATNRPYRPTCSYFNADMIDYMDNECAPNSFDVATSWYFPMNYCEHEASVVYQSVLRILRPGGHFINVMASSRYPARASHIVGAAHMRRFFDNNPHCLGEIPAGFKVVAIVGFNYFIERYRFWLGLCPTIVNKAMFRFDQIRGEKSGMKPYFYGIHLQKIHPHEVETPLGM